MNEPLINEAFLSSKLESLNVKMCLSNVMITEESNFDERNSPLISGSILKKELLRLVEKSIP